MAKQPLLFVGICELEAVLHWLDTKMLVTLTIKDAELTGGGVAVVTGSEIL